MHDKFRPRFWLISLVNVQNFGLKFTDPGRLGPGLDHIFVPVSMRPVNVPKFQFLTSSDFTSDQYDFGALMIRLFISG